jgi:SAM-dependent methyltransferase
MKSVGNPSGGENSILKSLGAWWRRECADARTFSAVWKLAQIGRQFLRESLPEEKRRRYGDMDYDWEFRVDTTSATVGWRTRLLGLFNSPYQPIEPELFREMMAALAIDFRVFTFIDVGSGKGRALLLAAEYPFLEIVGIELLPELDKIARENIGKFSSSQQKCRSIETICGDATEFELPAEPLVILLFNPLPKAGLRAFIQNVERSFRERPRQIYLVYANPIFGELLERSSLLARVGGTQQCTLFSLQELRRNES